MARMVPFPMLPTDSSAERRLYEGFLAQLDESFVVYHSVDWVLSGRHDAPEQGEADFVIAHPDLGVLVVEAKGGQLRYEPQRRLWFQRGRSGEHALKEDPFHQVRGEMHSLMRILEAQRGWERWRPSLGCSVALPDVIYVEDAHPGAPTDDVIDHDDLDRLEARVAEIMRRWRRSGRTFGIEGMHALSMALGYRTEYRTPLRLTFDEEDKRILELTGEQAYLRSFVLHRRRAAVTGPPGAGKTLLAVSVAQHLADSGKRTLLTCFNKRLAEYLRHCVGDHAGLHVAHFHGLCTEVAREAGLDTTPPTPGTPDRVWFEQRLPDLLEEGARALGARFDAIVVDEAQDFRAWWWPALLALHVDPDEGVLYLFSDDSQNLYGGGELPVGPDDVLPPLPSNLRNTRAIHEFVSVFFDAEGGDAGTSKGPAGRPVEILGYQDEDELIRLLDAVLANLLDDEEVVPEDVVVLTPPGREKSRVWARRTDLAHVRLVDEPEEGAVLWSTVHGFKGLERAVVVLAEVGDRHAEDLDPYLRVGASRARNQLVVIAADPVAADIRRRTRRAPRRGSHPG
jgi:AAA domain